MTVVDLSTWLIVGCIVQVSILFTTWYFIEVEAVSKTNREMDELYEEYSQPLPTPRGVPIKLFDDD